MPFTFNFCGVGYDSVFINSNGSVSFGVGNNDFSESAADMLTGPPRIAGLWVDLNPTQGGVVTFQQSNNQFTAQWIDVPEFFATGANTFEITLKRSANQIELSWGGLTASDGLAGISCGGAVTTGLEGASDLTELAQGGTINGRLAPAIFEQWNFLTPPVDVAGEAITFTAAREFTDRNEPNNTFADATAVSLPFTSADEFGDSGLFTFTDLAPTGADIDFFSFTAVAGQTLLAEVVSGGLDSLIALFDAAGNLLAVDDDSGAGLLSRLQVPIAADGTLVLAVTTFPDFGFVGAGNSGGRYVLNMEQIPGFVLGLGDDNSLEVALPFSFPFQGNVYTSVFVNSNGSLTFGAGDSDFTESISEFLSGPPRIAGLWDDLSPNNGGQVTAEFTATTVTIKFDSVPEFASTGSNTFSFTLSDNGDVSVVYGSCTSTDSIVGVTEGGGAADPGPTDLSVGGPFPVVGTTYQQFLGDFDLSNSLVDFQ